KGGGRRGGLGLRGRVGGGWPPRRRTAPPGARLAVQLYLREAPAGADTAALEVALRQLTLLEAHLKRFLDLGRAGPLRPHPTDLAALVTEAVGLLRPQCTHAGIDLVWPPPPAPALVWGDPGQLGQLIHNLLGNAVEAAGP